jgi:hypothetical protein
MQLCWIILSARNTPPIARCLLGIRILDQAKKRAFSPLPVGRVVAHTDNDVNASSTWSGRSLFLNWLLPVAAPQGAGIS